MHQGFVGLILISADPGSTSLGASSSTGKAKQCERSILETAMLLWFQVQLYHCYKWTASTTEKGDSWIHGLRTQRNCFELNVPRWPAFHGRKKPEIKLSTPTSGTNLSNSSHSLQQLGLSRQDSSLVFIADLTSLVHNSSGWKSNLATKS